MANCINFLMVLVVAWNIEICSSNSAADFVGRSIYLNLVFFEVQGEITT